MIKVNSLLVVLTLFLSLTSGNTKSQHRVIDFSSYDSRKLGPFLMESTFFIYGGIDNKSTGTAFVMAHIVNVDSTTKLKEVMDADTIITYNKFYYSEVLITAAHILKNIKEDYAFLCLRKKKEDNYETFDFKIKIRENGIPLWRQPDNDIDVAAMRISLPKEAVCTMLSGYYLISSKYVPFEQLNAGDDLMCLGFPHNTFADYQGFPILRSGKFASYRSTHNKYDSSFLFDFQVYPGNSGGPVYIDFQTSFEPKSGSAIYGRPAIVGIISEQIKTQDGKNGLEVAKVIYADYIFDAIFKLPKLDRKDLLIYNLK